VEEMGVERSKVKGGEGRVGREEEMAGEGESTTSRDGIDRHLIQACCGG